MSATVDERHSPFLRRFGLYLAERFPLLAHGILIVSYYSSNAFLARTLTESGTPMHFDLATLAGIIAIFCFFFHLRVFDEHKDFDEDSRHYPDRVLQRGVITLRELRNAGIGAIIIEAIIVSVRGKASLTGWLIAFGFSLLMLKEFFAGEWLRKHFLAYALSHMTLMPLLSLFVFSFATKRYPWEAPPIFWMYSLVGFFVTLNWEVSRKIRAPEQEIEGVDSYTKIFGTYGAAYLVLLIRVIDTALVASVGFALGFERWFYLALIVLYLICLAGFFQFRFRTTPRSAKMMEIYAGVYMIVFDILVAVEIVRLRGMELGP
jgi:4-hydroxybenzoate polyprenyltransferase